MRVIKRSAEFEGHVGKLGGDQRGSHEPRRLAGSRLLPRRVESRPFRRSSFLIRHLVLVHAHSSRMNWTGGRLQQHSNSNTLTHRQRQHFAKVRTHLGHKDPTNSSSPFLPCFLQPGEAECEPLDGAFGRQPLLKRQTVLDQHETVAPLVQPFTPIEPLPPTHRHISRRSNHDSSNTAAHPSVPPCEGNLTLLSQAAVVSRRKANSGRGARARKEHDKNEGYGNKRHASDAVRAGDVVKRQRDLLLARPDWAGLQPSRPVRICFPSSKERETIGKRHKTFRNETHRTARDGATRAPFLEGADTGLGGPWMSGALGNNENIDIKIGTDALATQVSAAAGNDSHDPEHRLTPSDPMLFELEGAVQELQPTRAPEYLTTVSHALQQEKEDSPNQANMPDTGMGSRENCDDAEADPIEDVERLLQELDGGSYRGLTAYAPIRTAVLAPAQNYQTGIDDDHREKFQLLNAQDKNSKFLPTSLQELESGREGSSMDQAETRGQAKGQLEFCNSPPKPCRLLSMSSPSGPQGPQMHSARAANEQWSETSLELPQPFDVAKEFDNVRWREFLGIVSDRTDHCPCTSRTGSERRLPVRGIGEDAAPSSALRNSSADRASRPRLSAERLIDDAERGTAWSGWGDKSQSMAGPPHSTFLPDCAAANTFSSSCSSALHSQASGNASAIPSPGPPSGLRCQITSLTGNASAEGAQGWIGDADGGEEAEAIWRKFVFGEDDRASIDNLEEERQSLEPAIRSTLPPEWSTSSSLSVEASGNSAAAGTPAPPPACEHLHSVGNRYGAAGTADASAGKETASGEEQASESIALVEAGNTGEATSPMGSRCLPVRIHDADAQANKASDDANTVAATAGESSGELASLDQRERIVFTKPKAFVGSIAIARPAAGGAIVEGNALKGTTLHTAPASIGRKISNPRKRRRGQQTAGFSLSISGIPSRNDVGYAADPIEPMEGYGQGNSKQGRNACI